MGSFVATGRRQTCVLWTTAYSAPAPEEVAAKVKKMGALQQSSGRFAEERVPKSPLC